jgi:hypothetical protein
VEIVYSYSTAKMLRSLLRAAQQKVGFNNVQFTIYYLQFTIFKRLGSATE